MDSVRPPIEDRSESRIVDEIKFHISASPILLECFSFSVYEMLFFFQR